MREQSSPFPGAAGDWPPDTTLCTPQAQRFILLVSRPSYATRRQAQNRSIAVVIVIVQHGSMLWSTREQCSSKRHCCLARMLNVVDELSKLLLKPLHLEICGLFHRAQHISLVKQRLVLCQGLPQGLLQPLHFAPFFTVSLKWAFGSLALVGSAAGQRLQDGSSEFAREPCLLQRNLSHQAIVFTVQLLEARRKLMAFGAKLFQFWQRKIRKSMPYAYVCKHKDGTAQRLLTFNIG